MRPEQRISKEEAQRFLGIIAPGERDSSVLQFNVIL